jgi:ABC-2 type transport system permease protein
VRAQLRAELFKQRSTRTILGLFGGMLGLVALAVLLHAAGLPAKNADSASEQLMILGRGEVIGTLFAALLGALAITAEFRHGTIRPTLLVTPSRSRVIAAKVWTSALIGLVFGLAASALAVGVGTAALRARGVDMALDTGDYALLIAGGALAASLWAAIGVGLGAVIRSQVPTLVGLCAWLLFVEGLLVGDVTNFVSVGKFAPGAAATALSGQEPDKLLAPAIALVLLGSYAAVAALAGALATDRRDVA